MNLAAVTDARYLYVMSEGQIFHCFCMAHALLLYQASRNMSVSHHTMACGNIIQGESCC